MLWTFVYERFFIAPLLEISSPTKRCGKSTLLDVLWSCCHRALACSNISEAALFRAVDKYRPTLLLDESDTYLKKNEALRGVINSGHHKGSPAVRCTGEDFDPHQFDTFCPKAVAGIGDLAATLRDRAVTIRLRRKTAKDSLKPVRLEELHRKGSKLRSRCKRWASDNAHLLKRDPEDVPPALNDRAKDNWRPLLAVADLAGGLFWGQLAREAAKALAGVEEEQEAPAQLLSDIKDLFAEAGADRMTSADIVERLVEIEARPWPEWRQGRPMTARQMAVQLSKFGIKPATHRFPEGTVRGYLASDFTRAWAEYCPETQKKPPLGGNYPQHPQQSNADAGLPLFPKRNIDPECCTSETGANPRLQRDVTDVAGKMPPNGEKIEDDDLPF
ncbi:MAG: DUF3631 domain-containing protein [Acidobacteriota bacterium]